MLRVGKRELAALSWPDVQRAVQSLHWKDEVGRLGVLWLVIGVAAVAMVAGLRLFRKRPPDLADLGELSGEWVAEHVAQPDDMYR